MQKAVRGLWNEEGENPRISRLKALLWTVGIALLLVGVVAVPGASAVSSVNVPLDHWSYRALEKLNGMGLLRSDLKGTKPYTRLEVARLVQEAFNEKNRQTKKKFPPLTDELLKKFEREFKAELGTVGWGNGSMAKTSIKPVHDMQARYVYSEGEPRRFRGYQKTRRRGIDAYEGTPLVYNNEGVIYGEHHNFSLQFSSILRWENIFSAYIEPIVIVRQNQGDIEKVDDVDVELLKGYAKFSPWNFELEVGRDSMWWGQGYHGSLLLTNNATPLDMVKISNPTPWLMPWLFRYLGPMKYTFFLSRLEADRVVPNPWFGGLRFNFKPFPIFEFGAATTFMFGGEGRPSLDFDDYLGIIGFQGQNSNRKLNQLGAIDFRLQLPFLWNTEIYGEYGGDDSRGSDVDEEIIFGDVGYLVGIYFPDILCDGRTDLRFEYANNAHAVDRTPSHWYRHSVYRSGYTHDLLIMGHPMNGDAVDFFARATHYLRNDLLIGLDYDYRARGKKLNDIDEKLNQFGADVTFDVNDCLSVTARYGYETVDNFNLISGEDRRNHLLMTVLRVQF